MKYEDMSDFEVNKLVADAFLPCDYMFDEDRKTVELANYQDVMIGDMHDQVLTPYQEFNPCNNPSDAWPIIIENKIGVTPATVRSNRNKDLWIASQDWVFETEFDTKDKNPLRAAMICFLKMKDAEK